MFSTLLWLFLLKTSLGSIYIENHPYREFWKQHDYILYYTGSGLKFQQASDHCVTRRGYLAVPNNADEFAVLVSLAVDHEPDSDFQPLIGADWVYDCTSASGCKYKLWWVSEAGLNLEDERWYVDADDTYFDSAANLIEHDTLPNYHYRIRHGRMELTNDNTPHSFICEFDDPCDVMVGSCPSGTQCVRTPGGELTYDCTCVTPNQYNAIYCSDQDAIDEFNNGYPESFAFNSKIYKYYNDGVGLSFSRAQAVCSKAGGFLAVFTSFIDAGEALSFLHTQIAKRRFQNEDYPHSQLRVWVGNGYFRSTCNLNNFNQRCAFVVNFYQDGERKTSFIESSSTVQDYHFVYDPQRQIFLKYVHDDPWPFLCEFNNMCEEAKPCPRGTRCVPSHSAGYHCECITRNSENTEYCDPPTFVRDPTSEIQELERQAHTLSTHYYMYYNDGVGLDWHTAQKVCERDNGYLVSLKGHFSSEMSLIYSMIEANRDKHPNAEAGLVWIGADWDLECGLSPTDFPNVCRYYAVWLAQKEPRNVFPMDVNSVYVGRAPNYHYVLSYDGDSDKLSKTSTEAYPFICESEQACSLGHNPCAHGADCYVAVNSTDGYVCIVADVCASSPCRNGGQCVIGESRAYSCNCADTGFTGEHCEGDVNECLHLSVCTFRGNCSNTLGSFRCVCSSGYGGASCQTHTSLDQNTVTESVDGLSMSAKVGIGVCVAAACGLIAVVSLGGSQKSRKRRAERRAEEAGYYSSGSAMEMGPVESIGSMASMHSVASYGSHGYAPY